MTPNEKDYMDRYIYQVIRRLPKHNERKFVWSWKN